MRDRLCGREPRPHTHTHTHTRLRALQPRQGPFQAGGAPSPSALFSCTFPMGSCYYVQVGRRRVFGCAEKTSDTGHGRHGGGSCGDRDLSHSLFFTTIPNPTCTVVLSLQVPWNLPCLLAFPSSTYPVVFTLQVSGVVDTGVRCHGIWNLCGGCCFSRQCWTGLSPLSPSISGLHFLPPPKWSWV
jgi:hypothetical protein